MEVAINQARRGDLAVAIERSAGRARRATSPALDRRDPPVRDGDVGRVDLAGEDVRQADVGDEEIGGVLPRATGSGTRRCLMDCTAHVGATPASPVGRRPTAGVSRNVVALRATGDARRPYSVLGMRHSCAAHG